MKFLEGYVLKIPSDLNMSVSQLAGSPYVRSGADSSWFPASWARVIRQVSDWPGEASEVSQSRLRPQQLNISELYALQ